MASTYSPKLRFELIGAGEQAGLWGTTTNKNVGQLIEQAIAGVTTVELDGLSGNYTLTALDGAPDQSRSAVIKCTYATVPAAGAINILIPAQTKLYIFRNQCGQTITVKSVNQDPLVAGVQLLNGEATVVFCDGTNALAGIQTAGVGPTTVANGGTGANSFTGGFIKSPSPFGTTTLTSVSTVNAATEVSGILPVANGGTGANTLASGRVLIGNGTGAIVPLAGGTDGHVLTWDGTLSAWVSEAPAAAGVASVTGSGNIASSGGLNPNITLTGQVPIANGGTGSNTQSGARTALGVPANDGTGASGTWNINVSGSSGSTSYASSAGNASTVTNGVYTTNFTGSNQNLSSFGYQKFPGGVIIQWGSTPVSGSQTTVFFPTTFPAGCYGLVVSRYKPGNTGGVNETAAIASIPSGSSVTIGTPNVSGETVTWLALGW